MSRRRIGQVGFGFVQGERGRNARLDAIGTAIDWAPLAGLLDHIHSAAKGEPAWPPLALFKVLLLGLWYDLSDVSLAEALDDRASFRRFCGFSSSEAVPERTAFVRFRKALVERQLEEKLFQAVVRQLEGQGLAVKTGCWWMRPSSGRRRRPTARRRGASTAGRTGRRSGATRRMSRRTRTAASCGGWW